MRAGEEADVVRLVERSFNESVAPLYPPKGVTEFLRHATPEVIRRRSEHNCRIFVALADDELRGMVEVRDHKHISMFFVATDQQRRGVGRMLLRQALEFCRTHNRELTELTVNSSPNAVSTYRRLGFFATGPETEKNGIRFTPMKMALSPI